MVGEVFSLVVAHAILEAVVMGPLLMMPRLKLSSVMIIVMILATIQEYTYLICHLM